VHWRGSSLGVHQAQPQAASRRPGQTIAGSCNNGWWEFRLAFPNAKESFCRKKQQQIRQIFLSPLVGCPQEHRLYSTTPAPTVKQKPKEYRTSSTGGDVNRATKGAREGQANGTKRKLIVKGNGKATSKPSAKRSSSPPPGKSKASSMAAKKAAGSDDSAAAGSAEASTPAPLNEERGVASNEETPSSPSASEKDDHHIQK
jgi:hypothetical protein